MLPSKVTVRMQLHDLQSTWDKLGQDDPMWAVLTDPAKRGGKWDPEAFFQTGRTEIRATLDMLATLPHPLRRERALDFGCGLGRLTQALGEHFERVDGVDISPSMIAGANRFNRHGERCRYHQNSAADLRLFEDGTFDLVYSMITLQHMAPRFAREYVREFFRVLKPGGMAVFQVNEATFPRCLVPDVVTSCYRFLRYRGQAFIEMFALSERTVVALTREAQGRIVKVDRSTTENPRWRSIRFVVLK